MKKGVKIATQAVFATVLIIGGANFLVLSVLTNDKLKNRILQHLHSANVTPPIQTKSPTKSGKMHNVKILMWTPVYGNPDAKFKKELTNMSPMPEWCELAFNKSEVHLADALVFSALVADLNHVPLPTYRDANQYWAMFLVESPAYLAQSISKLSSMKFNLTMTYRLDSDLPSPYAMFVKRDETNKSNFTVLSEEEFYKKKGIAWMVSHCSTVNRREAIVNALKKYIPVDIYGACGTPTCGYDVECHEVLSRKYKFYLSFENSNCPHYITEKFSTPAKYGFVMIVYGASPNEYDMQLPRSENAYIIADEYKTTKELAEHIIKLNNSYTEYIKYLHWHKNYEVRAGMFGFINLCHRIQDEKQGIVNKTFKTYNDLEPLWGRGVCQNAMKLTLN